MKLKRGLWEGKINETSYSFKKSSKIDEPQQDSQKEDFPRGSDGKESAWNIGDPDLVCGLGRFPGEENGYPLQYSYLTNSIDRGAWCRLLSIGSQRVGHDWATSAHLNKSILLQVEMSC